MKKMCAFADKENIYPLTKSIESRCHCKNTRASRQPIGKTQKSNMAIYAWSHSTKLPKSNIRNYEKANRRKVYTEIEDK